MGRVQTWVVVVAVMAACAGRAEAQDAYVGASLVADVARFSGARGDAGPDQSGEALGGAIRFGTRIGDRWGVDVELVRTGEMESDFGINILAAERALTTGGFTFTSGSTTPLPVGTNMLTIFPAPVYTSERQTSTVSAMLWAQQSLGSRAEIIYLGGVAFTRTHRDDHIEFQVPRITLPGMPVLAPLIQRFDNEYVFYGAGAIVGADLQVRMTDHLRLVPGVRLQMIDAEGQNGWLVRPAVGLQWVF